MLFCDEVESVIRVQTFNTNHILAYTAYYRYVCNIFGAYMKEGEWQNTLNLIVSGYKMKPYVKVYSLISG